MGERTINFRPGCVGVTPPTLNRAQGGRPNRISTRRFEPLITWLPKSLYMQFQRAANIFFAFVSVLVCFDWSPTMWFSTVVPFVGVLLWTALKDLWEDIRKKRDDDAENNRVCFRYNVAGARFDEVRWCEVITGDIILVLADQAFPADLLLLRAAGGQAFISTVNLDGETNLKERRAVELASAFLQNAGLDEDPRDEEKCKRLALKITALTLEQGLTMSLPEPCAAPTDCGGSMDLGTMSEAVRQTLTDLQVTRPCAMNYEHYVPRGCVLRNTPWIVSMAAYTGNETKTRMNMSSPEPKVSNMQRYLNRAVQILVVTLAAICLYCACMGEAADTQLVSPLNAPNRVPAYAREAGIGRFVIRFFVYWIIMYQLVPISLYVCFEMIKLILGFQITFDKQMVDPRTNVGANARTADLVEEIGQVDFIFSDKTGTLTENEMVYARSCIGGYDLGDFRKDASEAIPAGVAEVQRILAASDDRRRAEVRWFFCCLAVCHSGQVEVDEQNTPKFSGSSPDEVAFLDVAHAVGISFLARRRQPGSSAWELHIRGPPGEDNSIFTVLVEIPFDSDRKRMAVLCEYRGEFFCICKGADNVMSALTEEPFEKPINDKLEEYSREGLRTLAITSRIVERSFLEQWQPRWVAAQNAPAADRAKRMTEVAGEMEQDLTLAGITAIEDKLQEGVPEAIVTIKAAGIRFWVLTGDKTETAVEIVRACKLFTGDMAVAYLVQATSTSHALELMAAAGKTLENVEQGGLVIDGTFVKHILESEEAKAFMYKLAIKTVACVCCRLTPQQKRKLVELVREQNPATISLAVGDGANDVSMIQGAHVGIGIRGKEGNQAVQASDVAISQFRFLVPLLLCHGRRAYRRVATFLCYYIYKHVALVVMDLIWSHQFSFRGDTAVPEMLSTAYAAAFTTHTVLVILGFDRDVPDEVAIRDPSLYSEGLLKLRFNLRVFGIWMAAAVWHGVLAWGIPSILLGSNNVCGDVPQWYDNESWVWSTHNAEGEVCEDQDFWFGSVVAFILIVLFVNLRLWLVAMNRLWWVTLACLGLSVFLCFLQVVMLSELRFLGDMLQPEMRGVASRLFTDGTALAVTFGTPFLLLIDAAMFSGYRALSPSPLDKARRASKDVKDDVAKEAWRS